MTNDQQGGWQLEWRSKISGALCRVKYSSNEFRQAVRDMGLLRRSGYHADVRKVLGW